MTDYVLQAEDVAIHYGGVKAVDGVALTLEKGQIRGLIGPNGAGKSTVIDAITGRRKLTRGKVVLRGEDVSEMGVVERRMRGLSRSFQRTSIFGQMLVGKQVELASHKMGVEDSYADAKAVLQELDLWQVADIEAQELGYGEQRRLDLALALVGRPSVLLLDEPMAGMNVEEKQDMCRFILDVNDEFGTTIVLIEHDMGVVMDISDRVVVLDYGKKIGDGTPDEVRNNEEVISAYLGTSH